MMQNELTLPPTFVYRLDQRSEQEIFSHGFTSWGANEDLAAHVNGISTRNRTSAYIATTSDHEYMRRLMRISAIAQNKIAESPPDKFYVYKIITGNDFIHVANKLGNTALLHMEGFINRQQEWVALRKIPPSKIIEAEVYERKEDGKYIRIKIVSRATNW
ncbi:enterotoxin A family protein [Xenorhabdus sp. PB62.4]|uniref:scabin-related ADP-ribosyltransferase n=1 Tax=Xenorhabdus sp. PB62.4 TaxID=1851573 RepID=UPI001656A57E|nr:enterotoxin A family protein [Xenorhabdus sp. PB62.4]MBC8951891.1 pertussis toxin subunit 1 precursor [Xenorhabdus sp. PB62.4]